MRVFEIYSREKSPKFQAVKRGFSWPGFLFSIAWLFAKRMYLYGFICTLIWLPVISIEQYANPENDILIFTSLFFFSTWIFFGFFGNAIWKKHLLRKGYVKVDEFGSKDPTEAITTYIQRGVENEI